jgi:hypothetical protein
VKHLSMPIRAVSQKHMNASCPLAIHGSGQA